MPIMVRGDRYELVSNGQEVEYWDVGNDHGKLVYVFRIVGEENVFDVPEEKLNLVVRKKDKGTEDTMEIEKPKGHHFDPKNYVTKVVLETQKYFNGDKVRFLVPDEELVVEGEVYALYQCDNGEWCYNLKSSQGIFNDIPQGDIMEKVAMPIDDKPTFEKFLETMLDTYKRKNHDYGNSFAESCDEFGLVAAVVRMNDKMNRIKALYNKVEEAKVEESLIDTLLDLANYAVMTASYIKDDVKEVEFDDMYDYE